MAVVSAGGQWLTLQRRFDSVRSVPIADILASPPEEGGNLLRAGRGDSLRVPADAKPLARLCSGRCSGVGGRYGVTCHAALAACA